ncbi:hypothetical protein FEE95_00985 [Maribacter algarum]|uniref:Uncharacterized protein n=1 Tax=Maribacter algarum (ex Zhang et al. 2020) TaxID=2578118 RepID=A0A5S3PSR4_9FLAO|nr:hypothetical protein [Maribacter algarum]TMM58031.1 hypothetical protein FEE95_00985 [Maribacter algarum]
MSGLAKNYEKALRKELRSHGAWMPVTNIIEVGSYGYFRGGVFEPVGNIKTDYPDIVLDIKPGPPTKVNFSSVGTKSLKFDLDGNIVGSFAGLGNAKASLKFEFSKKNSIVLKADEILLSQIENLKSVAHALAAQPDWKKKYKVVFGTYTGNNCLVVCAREAGSEFVLNASADILQQIDGGKVGGGVSFTSSNNSTFDAVGKSGVLGIKLFKLNWLSSEIDILAADQITENNVIIEDDFGIDSEDDFEDDF